MVAGPYCRNIWGSAAWRGRGFEGAEHGEQHLHGGDGYDMEARGGEDDGARQHGAPAEMASSATMIWCGG